MSSRGAQLCSVRARLRRKKCVHLRGVEAFPLATVSNATADSGTLPVCCAQSRENRSTSYAPFAAPALERGGDRHWRPTCSHSNRDEPDGIRTREGKRNYGAAE